jgi:hypothetical protein
MAVTVRVGLGRRLWVVRLLVVRLTRVATIRWLLVIHLTAIVQLSARVSQSKRISKRTDTVAGDMTAAAGGTPGRPSRVDSKTSEKISKSTQRIKRNAKM